MTDSAQADVVEALRVEYAIDAADVHEVGGGQDLRARAYRVTTRAPRVAYFVKARPVDAARDVGAAVAAYLHEAGVPHVLAPLRSKTNAVSASHGRVSVTVYPFVGGRLGAESGLSGGDWRALGRLARAVHATRLPRALHDVLGSEDYRPRELDTVRMVDEAVSRGGLSDGIARGVATFWTARGGEIDALARRTEELGRRLAARALPHVLCHADLHTWNVIVAADGGPWVVDWDEVVLAPKERDLMFVVGGIGPGLVSPAETARFLEGYGDVAVDPLALAYYRHAWAIQDIGGYAERVLLTPSSTESVRSEAARILMGLFDPGEIVDLARAAS